MNGELHHTLASDEPDDGSVGARARELECRDRLLCAVALASSHLLKEADLDRAFGLALAALGEGSGLCRVYLFENTTVPATGEEAWSMRSEWVAPGIPISPTSDFPLPMAVFGSSLTDQIRRGQPVHFLRRELTGLAAEHNERAEALSLVGVPVNVEGQWWGVLGFDDCKTERVWSAAETLTLESAAAAFAGAIERSSFDRRRRHAEEERAAALEESNQRLRQRDAILEATAHAAAALLSPLPLDEAVSEALRIVGESTGAARVCLLEHLEDPGPDSPGRWRLRSEWDAPGVGHKMSDPKAASGTYADEAELLAEMRAGNATVADLTRRDRLLDCAQVSTEARPDYNVPVIVDGSYWGVLGFDDCRGDLFGRDVELPLLKIVATCIGGAIERREAEAYRYRAEEQLGQERNRASTEQAEALAGERQRIARDLHDTVAQCFTGVLMQLEVLQEFGATTSGTAAESFGRARELCREGLRLARRAVAALQPDEARHRELAANLRALVDGSEGQPNLEVRLDLRGEPFPVPPEIGEALEKIAREALGNAFRYSHAGRIEVRAEFAIGMVTLEVHDDGRGFDSSRLAEIGGFGLHSMQSRSERIGATLHIESRPGVGTTIRVIALLPQS